MNGQGMSVARISERPATSTDSFEDAIRQGIDRASRTLRDITSAWVKVAGGEAAEYRLSLLVSFMLDDAD